MYLSSKMISRKTMFKQINNNSVQPLKGYIIISEIFVYCNSDTPIIRKHYFSIFNKTIFLNEGETTFIFTTNHFDILNYTPYELLMGVFQQHPNTFWTFITNTNNEIKIIISKNKIPSLALLARANIPRKEEINIFTIPLARNQNHYVQISS